MKLKIWCEHCEGLGTWETRQIGKVTEHSCHNCDGKGYIDPPQQILDDLECAEIEREFIKANNLVYSAIDVTTLGIAYFVIVGNFDGYTNRETGSTKLEAYRKAKAWLDGRG